MRWIMLLGAYPSLTRNTSELIWQRLPNMAKITKKRVERIKPSDRDVLEWDDELRGFGIRVKPSGVRSYIIQYRNRFGRSRRLTVGTHGRLTAEEARKEARLLLSEVERGGDPAADRVNVRRALKFADFADRYMTGYVPGRKKPSTIQTDKMNLRCHILPALGWLPVNSVTRADVVRFHQNMKAVPGAANRTLDLLSHMLNVAEKWGLRPDGSNPCRHVERYPERKRERFLSAEEFARLGHALAEAERTATERPGAVAAIRLLILTGCRRSEILTLRWEHVDFENRCLRLPESKTGAKIIHLNAAALEVLIGLNPPPTGWVSTGAKEGAHLVNLKKPWHRMRERADLEGVRLHDLRHSFASVGVSGGLSLPVIGALLGNSQPATTARYAHLAADPLQQATKMIGEHIAAAMKGKSGELVELPGRKR